MNNFELTILALALALDAFSVAAAVGPCCCPRWGAMRLSGAFGGCQALMPLLGALAGAYLITYVARYDHWVAFGLLEFVGLKMIFDAFPGRAGWPGKVCEPGHAFGGADPSRSWVLLSLSLATSVDAFGAGVGLSVARANLWIAAPLIGIVAGALTYAGARLGARAEKYLGRRAALAGGAVLIALGVRMLRI